MTGIPESRDHDTAAVVAGFREAWSQFWLWEQTDSSEQLAGLRSSDASNAGTDTISNIPTTLSEGDTLPNERAQSTDTKSSCEVMTFEDDNDIQTSILVLDSYEIDPETLIQATPAYESFTPTNSNIYVGDDSDDMPFVPFFDDKTFNVDGHSAEYARLAWEAPFTDPDWHIIISLAATIIQDDHGVSLANIDLTDVLPLRLLSRSATNTQAVLELCSERFLPPTQFPECKS
ncbi:hypothetical protein HGRIS_000113 [Hohenbuehelia grisea]|uniref:Uncharacterized protein n=1 Tax=Hohenbuehelia grisea TaxID=104357 RepID=A0ABR3JRE7_9AGAR